MVVNSCDQKAESSLKFRFDILCQGSEFYLSWPKPSTKLPIVDAQAPTTTQPGQEWIIWDRSSDTCERPHMQQACIQPAMTLWRTKLCTHCTESSKAHWLSFEKQLLISFEEETISCRPASLLFSCQNSAYREAYQGSLPQQDGLIQQRKDHTCIIHSML